MLIIHMKKIAIVIPSLFGGGAEKAASIIANELNKHFHVYIVTLEEGISYSIDENISFVSLTKLHCKASKLIKLMYFPYQILKLKNTLDKITPDIVVSFMERTSFMLHLLKKYKNIYTFHNYMSFHLYREHIAFPIKSLRNYTYKRFLKNMHKSAATCIIMSKEAKVDLEKNFSVKANVEVIYYPFEIEKIQKLYNNASNYDVLFKNYDVLINVGRLEKQKGQWYLLRIFNELKKNKKLKLAILGEGRLKKYLVNLSKHLGLKTFVVGNNVFDLTYDVYFLGFQKNPFRLIKLSKLFIFTSLWEGFPNILVEALACGKSIITTDCHSGPRELLAPNSDPLTKAKKADFAEYGILMPNFQDKIIKYDSPFTKIENMWIETIDTVLDDEKVVKHYEKKAKNRAFDFNKNKIIQEWCDLINSVYEL